VIEAADAVTAVFRISDKIRVVAGPCCGLIGRLTNIQDETVTFESDGLQSPLQALVREVRKQFDLGDFVEVLCGNHRGVKGFIVHMDEDAAVIYRQKQVMYYSGLHQQPGEEVSEDSISCRTTV
jgi:transcription elongation factor